MADIKPFRGLFYNPKNIDIKKVVTPPYDVISRRMQERFYREDPHNVIRLILGLEEKSDNAADNRYTRAKKYLAGWVKNKILIKSKKPCFYLYTQQYLYKGRKRTRLGFIALMKIEDPKKSKVLPHEYTLNKPKEDRLKLIMNTGANLSPIFSLFEDRNNRISSALKGWAESKKPLFIFETEGVTHGIWELDDKKTLKKIVSLMRKRKIFIADGHHRYEVALTYKKTAEKKKRMKNAPRVMMYFSKLTGKRNLTILSTHRVVSGNGYFKKDDIPKRLSGCFRFKKKKSLREIIKELEKPGPRHTFGVYLGGSEFHVLIPKNAHSIKALIDRKKHPSLRRLDVTVLHDIIMAKLLSVKTGENSIKYVKSEEDACRLVDRGGFDAAFFLRPTSVFDMKAVAERGVMMPQKSTYFYPKLLTGLVINKF